jgi:hypothetical protein
LGITNVNLGAGQDNSHKLPLDYYRNTFSQRLGRDSLAGVIRGGRNNDITLGINQSMGRRALARRGRRGRFSPIRVRRPGRRGRRLVPKELPGAFPGMIKLVVSGYITDKIFAALLQGKTT